MVDLNDPALQTPCLVVDRSKVEANIERFRVCFADVPVTIRPHLKTVKSYDAAKLVMSSTQGPATVSTLKEAEEFGRRGVTDILYSVGIAPQKLERVAAIRRSGVDLKIITDNVVVAEAIAAYARETDAAIPTLIEIDVDGHRSGIEVGYDADLIAVARLLHDAGCLLGVMTHAGGSYELSDEAALQAAAERERAGSVRMADTLRTNELPCDVVSVGSTPTAFSSRSSEGITEIRAGVFLFFDLYQAGVGVCGIENIALSVLTTVIGHQRSKNWIVTDAGWMALSADRGTAKQTVDQHFGVVCDIDGRPKRNLLVLKTSQEHGVIGTRPGSDMRCPDLPIGTRLRILPNHACATAAQHDRYQLVDGGIEIVGSWSRFGGW